MPGWALGTGVNEAPHKSLRHLLPPLTSREGWAEGSVNQWQITAHPAYLRSCQENPKGRGLWGSGKRGVPHPLYGPSPCGPSGPFMIKLGNGMNELSQKGRLWEPRFLFGWSGAQSTNCFNWHLERGAVLWGRPFHLWDLKLEATLHGVSDRTGWVGRNPIYFLSPEIPELYRVDCTGE